MFDEGKGEISVKFTKSLLYPADRSYGLADIYHDITCSRYQGYLGNNFQGCIGVREPCSWK
jgi:hypothetical protein